MYNDDRCMLQAGHVCVHPDVYVSEHMQRTSMCVYVFVSTSDNLSLSLSLYIIFVQIPYTI